MAIYDFDKDQRYSNIDERSDFRSDQYRLNPQHSIYNHNNPDIATAELIALENLRVSGGWVTVLPRTDDNKYDKVWMEDPDPTYYVGFDFKAYFPPSPPEVLLTKFGSDAPNKFDVVFSRTEVLKILGDRMIRMGDIILIPHNSLILKARRFRVLHVGESGNYKYRWIYLNVTVENANFDETFTPRAE